MAAICPRWGCLKKPDVIGSSRKKKAKKLGSPSAVGVFGTPHRQVQGPRKEISWKVLEGYEGCDAAWAAWLVIRVEGISRKLPHAIECDQIHGMFARAY